MLPAVVLHMDEDEHSLASAASCLRRAKRVLVSGKRFRMAGV
jgi:hypothetical protein